MSKEHHEKADRTMEEVWDVSGEAKEEAMESEVKLSKLAKSEAVRFSSPERDAYGSFVVWKVIVSWLICGTRHIRYLGSYFGQCFG
jgi:hypothetical protein